MMKNPPHPGQGLKDEIETLGVSVAQFAKALGVTRQQLTILTGYKRSTRDAYIQRLRERGHVEASGDRVTATQSGVDALGHGYPSSW